MGEERSAKIPSRAVTVLNAVAALPVPSAPPSQAQLDAFAAWQGGKYAPDAATCSIDADGADTLTGPVLIYGYDSTDSQWRAIGSLNNAQNIALTADVGFEQILNDVGIFAALTISAAAGAALKTVKFTPVSQTD